MSKNTHETWMQEAIAEAKKAALMNEVPIGAVAVVDEKIIGRSHNVREKTGNPLGHAEVLLIESLSKKRKDWRLSDVSLYVTCEPCLMCAGALLQVRIKLLVYGCKDPAAGACGSLYNVVQDKRLNHRIEVVNGIMEKECATLLTDFFKSRRTQDN